MTVWCFEGSVNLRTQHILVIRIGWLSPVLVVVWIVLCSLSEYFSATISQLPDLQHEQLSNSEAPLCSVSNLTYKKAVDLVMTV